MSKTLEFLGSDSGFGKENTSAYYINGNKLILIDCGFTVFPKIKDRLKYFDKIDVIITHLHNDHAGTLSQLALYVYFELNKKVNIISKCQYIKGYLDVTGTPIDAYDILSSTDYVKLIKTEHVPQLDSYGMYLTINNKNIVYTGDTKTLEPFMPYIKKADELYVDISKSSDCHLKINEVFDILNDINNNGTSIYLMHVDDKEYVRKFINDKYEVL